VIAEGYVTAVRSPATFEIGSFKVAVTKATIFGYMTSAADIDDSHARSALRVGAYVSVWAPDNEARVTSFHATKVHVRDEYGRKLSGLGVIEKVLARSPEMLLSADGYRIRITSKTKLSFPKDLVTGGPASTGPASLAEVESNTWVFYSGKLDKDGVLLASHAKFTYGAASKLKADSGDADPDFQPPDFDHQIDGKIKPSHTGEWHAIPADRQLQEHIAAVGMSVVPEYQRKMLAGDAAKIPFRFYAIDDDKNHTEICARQSGLILIPKPMLDRLQTDQLAAVLADGVANELARQRAHLFLRENRAFIMTAEGLLMGPISPAAAGMAMLGNSKGDPTRDKEMEYSRARIALALMAEAHYDLRQAPVAWQLLALKDLPKSPAEQAALPFPDQSGYMFSVLESQYGLKPATPASVAAK
jgi:hypothetical protein